jgi:hypothetical protein
MSMRRTPPRGAAPGRGRVASAKRAGVPRWAIVLAFGVLLVGIITWQLLRSRPETAARPNGIPGPLGGPEIAQDVNTLVGKPAPAFTLPDSDGKRYTVTPGQGRPLVLISHMGIT